MTSAHTSGNIKSPWITFYFINSMYNVYKENKQRISLSHAFILTKIC